LGHYFELDTKIMLIRSEASGPCTLEFWENSDKFALTNPKPGMWHDSTKGDMEKLNGLGPGICEPKPGEPKITITDWCRFFHKLKFLEHTCPESYHVPILDAPAIERKPGESRRLYWAIIVRSAPDCDCASSFVVWKGCQFLKIDSTGKVVDQELHEGESECPGYPIGLPVNL